MAVTAAAGVLAIALCGPPARAGEPGLLVVVETGVGAGCDAAAVREAVAAELGVAVAAPGEATSAQASLDTLIVTVDRARITMGLRAGEQWSARSIPAPPEHGARLRAIAWLAGNLARDQTSAVLQTSAPAHEVRAADASVAPAAAPTEPPPVAVPETGAAAPEAAVHDQAVEPARPPAGVRWGVIAAGGPTITPYNLRNDPTDLSSRLPVYGTEWLIEVQRRSGRGALLGAAFETRGDSGGTGATVFMGRERAWRGASLESSVGLGFEVAPVNVVTTTTNLPSNAGAYSVTSATMANRPQIYLRAGLAAALSFTSSLDVLARVGAHLSSGGRYLDYLSATLGVRLSL